MKPGISQTTIAEYLSLPYLSSGMVVTLDRLSPAHAKWEQDNPDDDASSRLDFGTAIHDALLEGIDRIQPIDALDWRTKAAKEARDLARVEKKIPILAVKVPAIKAAVSAAKAFIAFTEFCGMFEGGLEPERTLIWQDDEGPLCKARPDALHRPMKLCMHVKTTEGSAAPGPFARTVDNMGYDTVLAFYERGCEAVGLTGYRHVILAIEQGEPWGCALYALSPEKASIAHARVQRAIEVWQQCVARGRFPSYDRRIHYLEAKPWDLAAEEQAQHRAFTEEELSAGVPL